MTGQPTINQTDIQSLTPLQWRLQIYARLRAAMDMQDISSVESILEQYSYIFTQTTPQYLIKQSGLPGLSQFQTKITLDPAFAYTFEAEKSTTKGAIYIDDHPLFHAVKTNNVDALRALINIQCPILYQVIEQPSIYITPLSIAVQNQFYDIVQILVDQKADETLNECSVAPYEHLITHSFPLLEAIKLCDKRLLDILLLKTQSDSQTLASLDTTVGRHNPQDDKGDLASSIPRQLSVDASTVLVGHGNNSTKPLSTEQRRQFIKSQGMTRTPIYTAFMSGGLDMVKSLVQDYDFDVAQVNLQGLNCIDELCYNWIDPKLRRILATTHYFNAEAILWLQKKHYVFTYLFAKQAAIQTAEATRKVVKGQHFAEPAKSKVNKLDVDRFCKGPMALNSRNDPQLQILHSGKNSSTTFLSNWKVAHVSLFMHSLQPFLQSQQHIDLLAQTLQTTGSALTGGQSAPSFDKVNIRYSQVFDPQAGSSSTPPPPQPICPLTEESRVWVVPTEIAQTSIKTVLSALSPPNAMIFAILTQRFDILLQLILQYISKMKVLNAIISPTTLVLMSATGWLRGLKLLFTLVDRDIIINSARGISSTVYNAIAPALTSTTATALIDTKALLTANIQRPAHFLDIALSTTSTQTWLAMKGICQKYKFTVDDIFSSTSSRRERELIPQQIYINHTVRHDLCNKYPEIANQQSLTKDDSTLTGSNKSGVNMPVAGASTSSTDYQHQYRPVLPPWVNTPESLQRIQDGSLVNLVHEYVLTELSRKVDEAGQTTSSNANGDEEESLRQSMTAGATIGTNPRSQLQRRGSTVLLQESTTTKNAHLHQGFGLDILYFSLTQGDWNTLLLLFRDFFIPMKNCAFFVIHESVFEPIKHLKRLQLQQKELLDISNLSLLFCLLFSDQLTPQQMVVKPEIGITSATLTPTNSNKAFNFTNGTPQAAGASPISPRSFQPPTTPRIISDAKIPQQPPVAQSQMNANSHIPQWVYTIFQSDLLYYLLTNQVNPNHNNEYITSKGEKTGVPLVLYVSLIQEIVDPNTQKVTPVTDGQKLDALQLQNLRRMIMLEGKCSNMPDVENFSYKADFDLRNATYTITHTPHATIDAAGRKVQGKSSKHVYACALGSTTLALVKKNIFFENFIQSSTSQQLFWDHWFGHHPKYAQYKQISLISTKLSLLHTKFAPLMNKHASTTEYRLVIWYLTSLRQALVYQYILDTLNPTLLSYCIDLLEHVIPSTAAKLGLQVHNKNHVVNLTTQTPYIYSALTNVIPLTFNKYYNMLTTNGCNFIDVVHVVQGIAKPIFATIAAASSKVSTNDDIIPGIAPNTPVYTMKTIHGYCRRVTQLYLGAQQYHPLPFGTDLSKSSLSAKPAALIPVEANIVKLTTNTTVLSAQQQQQFNGLHFARLFQMDSSDFVCSELEEESAAGPDIESIATILPTDTSTIELTNTKTLYFLNEPAFVPKEHAALEKAKLIELRDKQLKPTKEASNTSRAVSSEGTITTTTTFVPTNDAARALVNKSVGATAGLKIETDRSLLLEDSLLPMTSPQPEDLNSTSDTIVAGQSDPAAKDSTRLRREQQVKKKIHQITTVDNNDGDVEIATPIEEQSTTQVEPTHSSPTVPSHPQKTELDAPASTAAAPAATKRPKKTRANAAAGPKVAQQELNDEACEIPMDGPLPPPNAPPKHKSKGKNNKAKNNNAPEQPKKDTKTETTESSSAEKLQHSEPALKEEAPIVEETPVVEEAPVIVESVVEEAPVIVESVVEETPVVVEPVVVEPVVEETPVVVKPVVEETPVVVEPVVVEPVVEETPVVVEPVVEETPVVVEPVVEETPVVVEPVVEETPVVVEPVVEIQEPIQSSPSAVHESETVVQSGSTAELVGSVSTLSTASQPSRPSRPARTSIAASTDVPENFTQVTDEPKAEEVKQDTKLEDKAENVQVDEPQPSPKAVTLGLTVEIDQDVSEHPLPISPLNDPSAQETVEKERLQAELQQPYFTAEQFAIIASPTGRIGTGHSTPLSSSSRLESRPRTFGKCNTLAIQAAPSGTATQSNFLANSPYTTIGHLFPFITPVTSSLISPNVVPYNEHAGNHQIPATSRLTYPTHRVQPTKSQGYNPYLSSLYAAHRRSFTMLHLTRNNYLTWSDRDNFARLMPSLYQTDDTEKQLELTKTYFIILGRYYDFMIVAHDSMRREYKEMSKSTVDSETKLKKDKSQQAYEKSIIENMMKIKEDLDDARNNVNKQCQNILGSSLEDLKKEAAFTNSLNDQEQRKQDDMLKEHERKNTSLFRRMSQAVSKPFTASKKEENVQHVDKSVNSGFLGMSSRRSSVASFFGSQSKEQQKIQRDGTQAKLTAIGEAEAAASTSNVASVPSSTDGVTVTGGDSKSVGQSAPNQFISTIDEHDWVYISPFEISSLYDEDITILQSCSLILKMLFQQYENLYNNSISVNPSVTIKSVVPKHFTHVILSLLLQIEHVSYATNIYSKLCKHPLWRALFANLDCTNFSILSLQDCLSIAAVGSLEPNSPTTPTDGQMNDQATLLNLETLTKKDVDNMLTNLTQCPHKNINVLTTLALYQFKSYIYKREELLTQHAARKIAVNPASAALVLPEAKPIATASEEDVEKPMTLAPAILQQEQQKQQNEQKANSTADPAQGFYRRASAGFIVDALADNNTIQYDLATLFSTNLSIKTILPMHLNSCIGLLFTQPVNNTPLTSLPLHSIKHIAANPQFLQLLLKHGLNIHHTNDMGISFISLCVQYYVQLKHTLNTEASLPTINSQVITNIRKDTENVQQLIVLLLTDHDASLFTSNYALHANSSTPTPFHLIILHQCVELINYIQMVAPVKLVPPHLWGDQYNPMINTLLITPYTGSIQQHTIGNDVLSVAHFPIVSEDAKQWLSLTSIEYPTMQTMINDIKAWGDALNCLKVNQPFIQQALTSSQRTEKCIDPINFTQWVKTHNTAARLNELIAVDDVETSVVLRTLPVTLTLTSFVSFYLPYAITLVSDTIAQGNVLVGEQTTSSYKEIIEWYPERYFSMLSWEQFNIILASRIK